MKMNLLKLDDIADVIAGQSPESKYYNNEGEGYPFLQGKTDFGELNPKAKTWCTKPKKLAQKNDVLLSVRAPVGAVNIADIDVCIGRGICAIRTKEDYWYKYLYYYLKGHEYQIQRFQTGSTFKSITVAKIKQLKIHVPEDKDDQIKIANLLTQVESLIAKREESIELLDELLRSTFLDMFGDPVLNPKGWDTVTIEELVKKDKYSIKRGPFGGALKKEIFVPEGYLVYEQFHALNDDFSMARYFINEEKFQELKAFEVKEGDIIISCSGVYLGKLAIVPPNTKKGIINQALLKITLDENKMNNLLFTYIFRNENFINKFFGSNRGAGIPNFPPMKEFKKFKFIKPPKPLQDRFATIVQQVEETKNKYNESLDELHQLFGSLSQRAFKGELDLSGIKIPVTIKVADVKVLDAPSSSGAGELEEILDIPVFMRKVNIDKHIKIVDSYTDSSNTSVYSKDLLWMILKQADDAISYESINSKLEKYSFKIHPDYNQVQTDIFALIEEKKLMQSYDDENKKIVLSK